MMIIGCDYHPRYQQIAMMDTETGELVERRLEHENGEARAVYAMPFRGPTGCLSRFERLAALQATGSVARGDESTKWAHPL